MLGHPRSYLLEPQAACFVQTSHQVEVLNRRAARALSKIVEYRDQARLAAVPRTINIELKPVVRGHSAAQQQFLGRIIVEVNDCAACIEISQTIAQAIGGRGMGHLAEVQGYFHNHAAMRCNHCWRKKRGMCQSAMDLHFGDMFMP
jgi:hypothetical protein